MNKDLSDINFLSRKERKKIKSKQFRQKDQQSQSSILRLKNVRPKTQTQSDVFNLYNNGHNLLLHGLAGTGKTFLSFAAALNQLLNDPDCPYKKIVVVRSVVPSRDMGFLPGSEKEKIKVYEQPYIAICDELMEAKNSYELLKNRYCLEFISTSFIRGLTLRDSIVIVDEIQNCSFEELDTVITRIGDNCRLIMCGDYRQSDLKNDYEKKGLLNFLKIVKSMSHIESVEFGVDDIVRGPLVKDYIINRHKLGYDKFTP